MANHEREETLVDVVDSVRQEAVNVKPNGWLPWWRRPSPLWILATCPLVTIAQAVTIAPRIEIYTTLVCLVHKPGSSDFLFDRRNSSIEPKLNECAGDPVVQAAVATLTLVIMTSTGILTCLTTAWWGSLSDRRGRKLVLGISAIGFLFTDANFIISSNHFRSIPGGYWSLLVGPLIDGAVGGLASVQAAMHTYMADSTDAESRSRVFSLYMGLMFAGMAVGPTLGSILIHYTQKTLSVFYLAAAIHLSFILIVWFILPESLSHTRMEESAATWRAETTRNGRNSGILRMVSGFFVPLAIFLPQRVQTGKPWNKNWNLTLVAFAYGSIATLIGSYPYKFQYAAAMFGWTSETLGYWLSTIGASRVVYLMVVLPVLIKYFKRKLVPPSLPKGPTEADPLLAPDNTDSTTESTSNSVPQDLRSALFDLALARVSIAIETGSYVIICIKPTPVTFTVLGVLNAFASGLIPAMRSVALEMYNQMGGTESGRLFGGLSVVSALCQILGPAMFGLTYMNTVATFPRTIFFVSLSVLLLCAISLNLVRMDDRCHPDSKLTTLDVEDQVGWNLEREETLPAS